MSTSQSIIYEKIIQNKDDKSGDWCLASERRLLQKLICHKPVGINRHFNLDLLVMYMNNIFDSEDDINFEDYLTEKDLELLKQRRMEGRQDERRPMAFSPSYAIRPSVRQIEEKLGEYYDMELIQENESSFEELEKKEIVFELPTEYQFKDEMNGAAL